MPRGERPLDAEDTELGSFAADLRRLREKTGKPSYRELGARAHYSAATLSDAAGGRKLPSLAVTLAYVKACGGDPDEWEERWRAIAAPPEQTSQSPYVGLKAFQKEDADRFFGREKLTAKLVDLVTKRPFAGVFGASGSGKSSLLRAGLAPRLANVLIFTPGVHPVDECAVRLAQLTGESAVILRSELVDPAALGLLIRQHDEDLVLVVDQFEEIFTLCGPEQRDWFVQALVNAPHVVIGVRADFYGHVARHPELVEALEGAQLMVGPMATDDLRRAVTEPAKRIGATVESALVTRLVADVAGQAAALPLVQHALVETWHRRRGMTLSLTGYEEAGGVEHAIARTAETVFNDLDDEQQAVAKQIFLRLIALGEGTEDTKRRAVCEDLDAEVLERLATARLVTLSEQHAELTHEALIRSWPRLRDWIEEDRDALRVHHQLTEAATDWDGRDRDVLYKGARLAQASELNRDSLSEPERAFLTASQADGRRRTRRIRAVVGLLSVLVVLLASTAVFAVRKADEVAEQRNEAWAGRAVVEVMRLISANPGEAAPLALAAYTVTPGPATRDAVLNADAAKWNGSSSIRVASGSEIFRYLTLATNGEFFVESTGIAPATIRDRLNPAGVARIGSQPHQVLLSGNDRRAFTFEVSGEIQVWDTADLEHPTKLGVIPDRSKDVSVNHDGTLAVRAVAEQANEGAWTSKVFMWDLRDAVREREIPLPPDRVYDVAAAPSGREIALIRVELATNAMFAEIRGIDGEQPRVSIPIAKDFTEIAISKSGRFLVVGSADRLVVWDVADAAGPVEWATVPRQGRRAFLISGDEQQIALENTASVDVWDIGTKDGAVRAGSFGGFRGGAYGLRYRERENAFGVVDQAPSVWSLRTDLQKVKRGLCREQEIRLSDEEWQVYFPGVARVEVC